MPSEIDGTSDQKKLFGCNVIRYIQLLLYRSKTLIEGQGKFMLPLDLSGTVIIPSNFQII